MEWELETWIAIGCAHFILETLHYVFVSSGAGPDDDIMPARTPWWCWLPLPLFVPVGLFAWLITPLKSLR